MIMRAVILNFSLKGYMSGVVYVIKLKFCMLVDVAILNVHRCLTTSFCKSQEMMTGRLPGMCPKLGLLLT